MRKRIRVGTIIDDVGSMFLIYHRLGLMSSRTRNETIAGELCFVAMAVMQLKNKNKIG